MRTTTISNQSSPAIVALSINIPAAAGTPTPIMAITAPRGARYLLHNRTLLRSGMTKGVHIVADLRRADGTKISPASRLVIASRGPADEFETKHRAFSYGIWRDLDAKDQRSDEFKATLVNQTDLNVNGVLVVPEAYQIQFLLDSPDAVDWTKSTLEITVEEQN